MVGRGDGRQAVDVAVEHAERRGDEDRVVDFHVGRALRAGTLDVAASVTCLAALLDLAGDREQRLQLGETGAVW